MHQGLSELEFYGDLVNKFKKIVDRADFSDQFRKIIVHYKRVGYNINIMRQSACLVFNPITVNNFASLFNCTPVGRASDSMMARHKAIHFSWLGPELFCILLGPPGLNCFFFFCSSVPVVLFDTPGISRGRSQHFVSVESSSLARHSIYL